MVIKKRYIFFTACFVSFIAFFITYKSSVKIFTNDYIFNNFISQKGYSKACLVLSNDENLNDNLYTLFKKYNNQNYIAPIFISNLPSNFNLQSNIEVKKYVFINLLLPLIFKIQQEVLQQRQELFDIVSKLLQTQLNEEDLDKIRKLAKLYNIHIDNDSFWDYSLALEELLIRVDVIPISLVLAMAIKESGWGTSRFALESNAIFGQWVYNDALGSIPKNRPLGKKHSIKVFKSLEDSIRSYYKNLNTHLAYSDFRKQRVALRSNIPSIPQDTEFVLDTYMQNVNKFKEEDSEGEIENNYLNPIVLALTLNLYSEYAELYTQDLVNIIRINNLFVYDNIKGYKVDINPTCLTIK